MDNIEKQGLVSRIRNRVAGVGLKMGAGLAALTIVVTATIVMFLSNTATMSADVQQSLNVSFVGNQGEEMVSLPLGSIFTGDATTFRYLVNNRGNSAQDALLTMTCSDEGPITCNDVMLKNFTGGAYPCTADGNATKYILANQSFQPNQKTYFNSTLTLNPYFTGRLDCTLVAQ
jgi:hypothetical protein